MHSCLHTASKTADIVLIQEPRIGAWNQEKGSFLVPEQVSFTCLLAPAHNNNTITPRVATFVSQTFPGLKVSARPDIIDDPYLQILKVSAPGVPTFLIYNIYNEQYDTTQQWTVQRLLQNHTFPHQCCFMVGDMNAHHPWRNSKRDMDSNGDLLATLMEAGNFYLVNEPEAPTFFQYCQATSTFYESVLDLAFATGDLFEWISNWAVCDRDTE